MKRDMQATEAANFLDPRSYVAKDGRHLLMGRGNKDWAKRVEELRVRSSERCEFISFVSGRCRAEARDPHHVTLRSVKRDDRLEALLAVCGWHHDILDLQQREAKRRKDTVVA
jgi:hypothetical protein